MKFPPASLARAHRPRHSTSKAHRGPEALRAAAVPARSEARARLRSGGRIRPRADLPTKPKRARQARLVRTRSEVEATAWEGIGWPPLRLTPSRGTCPRRCGKHPPSARRIGADGGRSPLLRRAGVRAIERLQPGRQLSKPHELHEVGPAAEGIG